MLNHAARFKLSVQLSITRELGYAPNGEPLQIGQPVPDNAYWRDSGYGDRLTINEDLNLGPLDFAEAMRVLVQLHDTLSAMRHE